MSGCLCDPLSIYALNSTTWKWDLTTWMMQFKKKKLNRPKEAGNQARAKEGNGSQKDQGGNNAMATCDYGRLCVNGTGTDVFQLCVCVCDVVQWWCGVMQAVWRCVRSYLALGAVAEPWPVSCRQSFQRHIDKILHPTSPNPESEGYCHPAPTHTACQENLWNTHWVFIQTITLKTVDES